MCTKKEKRERAMSEFSTTIHLLLSTCPAGLHTQKRVQPLIVQKKKKESTQRGRMWSLLNESSSILLVGEHYNSHFLHVQLFFYVFVEKKKGKLP